MGVAQIAVYEILGNVILLGEKLIVLTATYFPFLKQYIHTIAILLDIFRAILGFNEIQCRSITLFNVYVTRLYGFIGKRVVKQS